MRNTRLEKAQDGITIAWRNINILRYADDTTLMAESEEELKDLLMKVKVESEKVGLKLNIKKTKIMASGPITSWEIDGETVETVSDFILGGSKVTAECDCSHEIKRRLLLERKVMTNLDNILKSRDITLPTKVHLVKATVFPMVMYGCESWTVKKAEHWRIDAFERNAGLEETQAGIKIAGRNINNLRYADDTTLMAESEEELKSLLMKVREESEKIGLNSTYRKWRWWHLVPSLHGK